MVSLCTEYYQLFLAQGLLLGIGMSFLAIPTVVTVPKYFKKNRGLANGISVSGSSLGGIVWPIMFDQLLNHDGVSFSWTMRVIGFTMLPLLLVAIVCVRNPPKQNTSPEQSKKNAEKEGKADVPIWKNPTFIILCLGLAIAYFGFFTPFFFITTYAVSLGMSTSLSFYLVSMVNGASMFGRILPGFLSDKYGHFNIMCIALFCSAAIAMCWTAAESTAGLIVWTLAYGFSSGVSRPRVSPQHSLSHCIQLIHKSRR